MTDSTTTTPSNQPADTTTAVYRSRPHGGQELGTSTITMSIGPQHPATHGTLRQIVELDGEVVVSNDQELGYLNTGFEKLAEHMTFNQFVTVTDRMNYLSPLCNNIGWVMAVEEALGIEVTERCKWARVALCELARIADHIACVGLQAMDLGAFSVMLWGWIQREHVYDVLEATTGIRLTNGFARVGGMMMDLPDDFETRTRRALDKVDDTLYNMEKMLDRNRIWIQRTVGVGAIPREDLIEYGVTGPLLRATGTPYDVRRADPYLTYDELDFEVPTHEGGDVWSRYKQRMAEIRESKKILLQVLDKMPSGPINVSSHKQKLPPKGGGNTKFREKPTNMEDLIHHFKQVMDSGPMGTHGIQNEPGREFYSCTEAPNGELGWHVVFKGDGRPSRVRVRPPSLINYQAMSQMVEGGLIADMVAVLSSLNVIAGELDR